MPGMPKMPGVTDLVNLLQQQTEALASLPRTMLDLNRSILSLIDVIASARDTIASSQRVSARLERIVDEMEEPVLALRPGLQRLAVILDDPAVETVPDSLRKINEEVLPLVKGIQDTQTKVNNIATLAEETSNRLAGLPGANFLLGRRKANGPGADRSAESQAAQSQPAEEPSVQESSVQESSGQEPSAQSQATQSQSPAGQSDQPPGNEPPPAG